MDRRVELFARWREIWLLSTTIGVLEWDEETSMPPAAAPHRSEQLALLAGLVHDRLLDPRLREIVDALDGDAQAAVARDLIDRHALLPKSLVLDEKTAAVAAQQAWLEARNARDFRVLAPHLRRVVDLKRQVSRCLGGSEPWEAHLREHEPGANAADVARLVDDLGRHLSRKISSSKGATPLAVSVEDHEAVVALCADLFGYDRARGSFGRTVHPFCSTLGPDDVRIALRKSPTSLADLLGYTMHELGHALYEQNVPTDLVATPAGELRSVSLHESQSRLWEIEVGRSRALWSHLLPQLAGTHHVLDGLNVDDVVQSLRRAEPSIIRVGSDPITYNLHIVVRVELERALLDGTLSVDDLAQAWSDAYDRVLGLRPRDDVEGVLQDGHWPAGMFGYFPTYAIGNLAAAQLMKAARRDLPFLDEAFAHGDTSSLRDWLRVRVWRRAALAPLSDVIVDATGAPLDATAFLEAHAT